MVHDDSGNSVDRPRSEGASGQRQPLPSPAPSDTPIDLAQTWSTLRKSRTLILGTAAGLFVLVMGSALASRMEFKSTGRLYLGELEEPASTANAGNNGVDISGNENGDLASELQILQSESLIESAIVASGMNAIVQPAGTKPPRMLGWLLSRRDEALVDPAPELRAQDVSLAKRTGRDREYRVRFTTSSDYELLVDDLPLARGKLDKTVKAGELVLTLKRGVERGPQAGAEYDLRVRPLDELTQEVTQNLLLTTPKPIIQSETAKVVALEFRHSSPVLAAAFLRALMTAYLEQRQAWKTENASVAERFVGNQLALIRGTLDATESKLADYRSNTSVVVMDNEAQSMVDQLGKYEEQRVAARLQVSSLLEMKRALSEPGARSESFLLGGSDDPVLVELASGLSRALRTRTEKRERFNEGAPDVRQAQAQVESQLGTIHNYVTSRLARAKESLTSLEQIIGQLEKKLKTVPGAELGRTRLERESDVYSKLYSSLLQRQQQAAMVMASTVSKNHILDMPHVAAREDSPKLVMRLLSPLLGLLLGAVFAIVRSMIGIKLNTESDVGKVIGGAPMFAKVPVFQPLVRNPIAGVPPVLSFLSSNVHSSYSEAFRTLRTNIRRVRFTGQGRSILVTSPCSGDGKTTCALSLAGILAAANKRVLLIDADLRRPTYHALFSVQRSPGWSDVIRADAELSSVLHFAEIPTGSFLVSTAGTPVSPDLLSSASVDQMLSHARAHFDFVILDVPSFPAVSDALELAGKVDFVLSVMRLQATDRRSAAEHVRGLAQASPFYAVVVNGVEPDRLKDEPSGEKSPSKSATQVSGKRLQSWISASRSRWVWSVAGLLTLAFMGVALGERSDEALEAHSDKVLGVHSNTLGDAPPEGAIATGETAIPTGVDDRDSTHAGRDASLSTGTHPSAGAVHAAAKPASPAAKAQPGRETARTKAAPHTNGKRAHPASASPTRKASAPTHWSDVSEDRGQVQGKRSAQSALPSNPF